VLVADCDTINQRVVSVEVHAVCVTTLSIFNTDPDVAYVPPELFIIDALLKYKRLYASVWDQDE
jgi:hypothetical protein